MPIPDDNTVRAQRYVFGGFELSINPLEVRPTMVRIGETRGSAVYLEMDTRADLLRFYDRVSEALNATDD